VAEQIPEILLGVAALGGTGAANSPNVLAVATRLNQVDLRFGKMLRFGRTCAAVNLDVYNVFNANTVLTMNYAYASWQRPTSILLARFAKISAQLDF
jgi:hypothetical protein